jgi:hypothetical protein
VAELERLRKRLRNVEEHLDYHAYWQRAVVEQSDFFARAIAWWPKCVS